MLRKKFFSAACICAAVTGVAGCVSIPPDRDILPQRDLAQAQIAADIRLAGEGWPQAQWWKQYGDPQLDGLIRQALAGNPSLAAAAARMGSAQATLTLSKAAEGIGIGFNAATNRQRYSANGLFPPPIGGSTYTDEMMQVQARYDFDWWGKHRAQIAAALGEGNARRADYAQAEQILASAVAQTYFNLQSIWAQRDNLGKMAALQQALVEDKMKRVAHGLAPIDEQHLAQTRLSDLNQRIAQLDARAIQEREALRALAGADGNALMDLKPAALPDLPHAMPSKLGFELLARRPDLQAARWRVEASLDRVEAAEAAFYPDINLAGSVGLDAISLGHLFEAGSRTFLIGPSLSLPLFNSGTLKGRLGQARSERNEIIADYNQSVLNAVRDVAQAGAALKGIESQLAQQANAAGAAGALLRSAQARFRQGLANRAQMLEAEMAVLQQNEASLELQHQRMTAEIALTKSLGGGYRAEPSQAQAALAPSSN